jgi:biopolymer transport protein ExbD
LRTAIEALPVRPLAVVQAEAQAPYARLVEAMDALRSVGIDEIVLSPGRGE